MAMSTGGLQVDVLNREAKADVRVTARGELCAVATHILRWVTNPKEANEPGR